MKPLNFPAKTALCGLYQYSGCATAAELLGRLAGRRRLAILLFHRVTDAVPEDGLTVGTARFARICRMLRRRFRVVPLAEVFRIVRQDQPMPPRTVAVTFDDSYRDNLDAARVLADHGLPACFFVPTGYVGTDRAFAWDRGLPSLPNLTWDDLRTLARLGFEVGSHTVTHPDLGAAPRDAARRELFESKAVLEHELGRRVRWFAYPFGGVRHFRPELLPVLEEAGYEGGVSAYGGFVHPGVDSRMLPRVAAPPFASVLNLELHLAGSLDWMYALKRLVGWMPPVVDPYRSPYALPAPQ